MGRAARREGTAEPPRRCMIVYNRAYCREWNRRCQGQRDSRDRSGDVATSGEKNRGKEMTPSGLSVSAGVTVQLFGSYRTPPSGVRALSYSIAWGLYTYYQGRHRLSNWQQAIGCGMRHLPACTSGEEAVLPVGGRGKGFPLPGCTPPRRPSGAAQPAAGAPRSPAPHASKRPGNSV